MRIVHLTDLHLRHHLPGTSTVLGRESRRMPEILAQAVARVQRLAPDLGVLSGDLVDVPEGADVCPDIGGLAWQDLQIVHSILERADIPWVVLPGNHDLVEQVREFYPCGSDTILAGYRILTFDDRERADHVPERTGAERARLEEAMRATDGLEQIHVQHYVVQPRLDAGYPHTYADGESIVEMLSGSGRVALVLSGHYHPGVTPFLLGKTWYSVAPALCVQPFPLMVYDLDADGLRWQRIELEEHP
jgi:3',5'-cyclic AMP phosphodiesterase CpdA